MRRERTHTRRTITLSRALSLALALAPLLPADRASAQDGEPEGEWPTETVRFIVPFPPGGTVDPLARLLGEKLQESLGQTFLVENRPGAAGSIGAAAAARAEPDGATFLFCFDTQAVNPFLLDLPFDTRTDLVPVMLVGTAPMAIATPADRAYESFQDAIAAARADPGGVTYGTIGAGSLGNLAMALLQEAGEFELTHIPYKGGAPMTRDALGGHIDLAIGSASLLGESIRSGQLRGLAITHTEPARLLPDVPTLDAQGFEGFSALSWWGVLAPAGTPEPILERFHAALVRALQSPDVRAVLRDDLGMDLVVSTRAAFGEFLGAQMDRWGAVVREHGIRPN